MPSELLYISRRRPDTHTLLPAALIQSAQIIKKCVVIGTGDHIEIWAEERWDEYNRMSEENFEDNAETLTEFLI